MNIDVLLAILKKKYCKSSAIPSFQNAQLAEGLLLRNKFLQQLFVSVEAVGMKQILRQKDSEILAAMRIKKKLQVKKPVALMKFQQKRPIKAPLVTTLLSKIWRFRG
jgi:hypothetical protein